MTQSPRSTAGTTLLELCVSMAVLALAATVVTLAARRMDAPTLNDPGIRIAVARRTALSSARPVLLSITRHDTVFAVTALPDGSVLADSSFHLDRLSGRHRSADPDARSHGQSRHEETVQARRSR